MSAYALTNGSDPAVEWALKVAQAADEAVEADGEAAAVATREHLSDLLAQKP